MKREILFRGKRVDNNEWVYGSLIVYSVTKDGKTKKYDIKLQDAYNTNLDSYRVISETVSQFTGLTDKNGVKIFEGDKLTDGVIIYVVEYNTQNTSFAINPIVRLKTKKYDFLDCIKYDQLGNGYYSRKDLEVIGNIHDA